MPWKTLCHLVPLLEGAVRMVSKKQWVWGEGHRGNQTHKNIYSSLLASYRISTFSRQMLEDAFHVNSSMSGEAEGRREKQSQKCLIESSDFLAVKAGTEKELLRAKTRVGQGMASVYTKGLSTRKQWKRIERCRGILGKLQHWKRSPSFLCFLLALSLVLEYWEATALFVTVMKNTLELAAADYWPQLL